MLGVAQQMNIGCSHPRQLDATHPRETLERAHGPLLAEIACDVACNSATVTAVRNSRKVCVAGSASPPMKASACIRSTAVVGRRSETPI